MTKYLFVDTETSGLPKHFNAPPSADDNWPRILQIAWQLVDDQRQVLSSQSFFVIPSPDLVIDSGAQAVNGLTVDFLYENGQELEYVLTELVYDLELCDIVICHNTAFDIPVIESEFMRVSMTERISSKLLICTMKQTRYFCDLPRKKWPKLSELYRITTGKEMTDAHKADYDVQCLAEAFFVLLNKIPEQMKSVFVPGDCF